MLKTILKNKYKIFISIIFGLIGLFVNFQTIIFPFGEYTAAILLGLLFPMLITLSWGWKYGLLSALAGGCQTMWLLWGPSNGYAIFLVAPPFTLWVVWHGIFAELRKKQKSHKWWLSMYIVEIPFRLLNSINLLTLSRWAITLNPPSWSWATNAPNTIPLHFSIFVTIKQAAVGFVILLLVDVLLNIKYVRSFLKLEEYIDYKKTGYIISAFLLLGCLFWLLDSVFYSFAFHKESSFTDLLALNIPDYNVFIRIIFFIFCLVSGLITSKILRRQREGEIALKESNTNFRQVVSNITTVIWKADIGKNGTFENTYSSPVLDNLLELPAGTLQNDWDKYFSYIKPKYLERINNAFREAIESPGKVIDCEYEVLKGNGQTAWFCSKGRCFEKEGKLHVFGSTTDITEHQKAEEKIQHLNLILRTIRNVNQLIVEEKNRDVLIQKVCEILIKDRGYRNAWLVLLGEQGEYINSAEAGLGKNFIPMRKMLEEGTLTNCGYHTLKKKDLVIIKDPIKECLDCPLSTNYSGQSSYSICIKHGDNIYGLLSVSASKYYINDKEEQDLFKEVAGDIAFALHGIEMEKERKQAEEALKASEEKMRLMINNSHIGFSATDLNGNFIEVNPAVCDMTGYSSEEMINKHFGQFSHPDDRQQNKELNKKLLENKIPHFDLEKRYIHKNGSIINVLIRSQIVRDDEGKPLFEMAITEDITKRKLAEDQVKQDLKIKTALLQELYHRTKNNMQVIISMLKIQSRNLENRSLTENEGTDYLHDSLYNVINKVKAMSLVHEKLYQAKDLSHINLKEYIGDLVRYLLRSYNIRTEKVILDMKLEEVFVLIDSAIPLGLVLNEIISNVFKHAFPHTKKDKLFIELYKEKDETINIHLNDNGVGIPNDFDLKNVNTMGLQTVFSLTEYQLMGEVKYDTKKGLKWHISFKDNQHKERV